MASPLVQNKLYLPKPRPGLVARPRLSERLRRGSQSKLTLISAPAGFGKTTLLADWLADSRTAQRPVAWLSLEDSDRSPLSFWTYLVTAVQGALPEVGASALALLQSAPLAIETVLGTLLNELSAAPAALNLVLDDYHLVDSPDIQAGMAYLLEQLPPQLHLVLSTRADPALPLARLRARGELVEIRAGDLRFTLAEMAVYLNEVTDLELTATDLATLEGRTEGWIAALQMAAISLQGRTDAAAFIAGFAGDDRYIVDYLVEEVLAGQPEPIRNFLMQTAILDRLSGPLCDAVTGQPGGRAMLASLDRANLFLIPLDDRRRWYRYHHLFADVLQAHLLDQRADEVPELHRRASQWYDQGGQPVLAVRHALAAGDPDRAASLVELAIPAWRRDRQEATIRRWINGIPDELVQARPVLAVGFIGALMASGELAGIDGRLTAVELVLQGDPATMVVVDEPELVRLPGAIQTYRAALALGRGDAPATIEHAGLALARAADGDHLTRAAASALAGLARWGGGDLEGAHRAYSVSVDGLQRAGHLSDVLGCSITLADLRITQGRLSEALHTYQRALQLAANPDGTVLRGTADMYVGLSQLACERDDLAAAQGYLARAQALGEQAALPQNAYRWRVAMARLRAAEADHAGALALFEEAERVYVGDFSPNVRPVPAMRVRGLLAAGRLAECLVWAREQGLRATDELSYLREFEHITLARLLLARFRAERDESTGREAGRLLGRLAVAAEAGGRTGSLIEILVLQALSHQAHRDVPAALVPLAAALSLAEPEGYLRTFTGEGPALTALLVAIAQQRPEWAYLDGLLPAAAAPVPPAGGLVQRLSERELTVLRLLAGDLDGPAIARQLTVSLNTVRTHTKSIYAKLGVNSRRAAVRRATELGLLAQHAR